MPPEPRPSILVLVAGTHTEVGKTYATVAMVDGLRAAGLAVAARKPVQSFEPGAGPTDADLLAEATGEDPVIVCPAERWLPVPMAPPMAADALGRPPFTVVDLVGAVHWPEGTDIGLVESVGGVRSPIAEDGDTVELAAALRPDVVVLVADARLGAINAVLTALPPLAAWPCTVLLNRFDGADELQRRNLAWLTTRHQLDVRTSTAEIAGQLRSRFAANSMETR